MATTYQERSQVPAEHAWDLTDLFPSEEAWLEEYEALRQLPAEVAARQGTLGRSAGDLLAWYRTEDEISLRLTRLGVYAGCRADQDTADGKGQDMRGKAMSVAVAVSSAAAFAAPEIMAIPDETLDAFFAQEPALETYRRNIYLLRRRKAHILSPECEALLSAAGCASSWPSVESSE